MKKSYKFLALISFASLVPLLVSAFDPSQCAGLTGIGKFICQLQEILNSFIPLLIALGLVYFIWGVVRYVIADGEEAKDKGKDTMLYGVIGFAVIAGIWGLVNIVVETFDLDTAAPDLAPLVVGGQGTCTISSTSKLQDVLCYVTRLINDSVIPFIFAVATVFFVWGAIKFFILNADEEAQRDQGRQFMIWGVVALAVMLSVWGLVGILTSTFGVDGSVLPQVKP
jgi:hypothetical protein